MPYYRHARTDTAAAVGEPYSTKQSAATGIAADQTIAFIASNEEITAWHHRECERSVDGTYQLAPTLPPLSEATTHHYLHLSAGNPGLVAYTPSDEFGVEDRQLRCKPGKYLQKFYAEAFTAQQIVAWADAVKADGVSMHFTNTSEQCVRVYRALHGPDSCMGNGEDAQRLGQDYRWSAETHPAQVYGGGDVSIAYIGHIGGELATNDTVIARAVVNTLTKKYARIYGTASGELRVLLTAAGYAADSHALEGARILARPRPSEQGGYFMPYVDGMRTAIVASASNPVKDGFLRVTSAISSDGVPGGRSMDFGKWAAWLDASKLQGWASLCTAA